MKDCVVVSALVVTSMMTGWLVRKEAQLIDENEKLSSALKVARIQLNHMTETWQPPK